jgi:hypothetical protein
MGFMMSITNAIGFYKSSKGMTAPAVRVPVPCWSLNLTQCPLTHTEARAEISAGVSRFTAQYVRSSLLG